MIYGLQSLGVCVGRERESKGGGGTVLIDKAQEIARAGA